MAYYGDNPDDPTIGNDPRTTPSDPTRPPPQRRWNTTPMWQDPFNPPSPGDPYWADWIAVNPTWYDENPGYPRPTTPPTTKPPPTTTQPPPTGPIDPGGKGIPIPPPKPDYQPPPAPTFNAPTPGKPPPFGYPDFKPPTGTDVWDDPSYQFRFGEGFHGLQNSKAAMGTIGTGGSIKDFINYGQNFASNEYNNVYNRDLQTYALNRGNALDTYNTNYGTQYKDPFLFAYQNAQGKYGADALGYTTQVNAGLNNQQIDFNRDVLNYNQTRNNRLDSFDEWYKKFLLQLQATQL